MAKTDAPKTETPKAAAKEEAGPTAVAAKDVADVKVTVPEEKATKAEPKTSGCVVNGGKGFHVGQAVNGKVCSYHAMHYDSNGNRR